MTLPGFPGDDAMARAMREAADLVRGRIDDLAAAGDQAALDRLEEAAQFEPMDFHMLRDRRALATAEGMRVISYGGGVQSTALVVLAAQGIIDFPVALFSNVGDDSEHPATLSYVRQVAIPWAAKHGVTIHELHRVRRDGTPETLWGRLMREESRSLPIPVRMPDTGAPGTRNCTADFKIRVIAKWLRQHGATAEHPATTAIGFSTDEFHRSSNRRTHDYEVPTYPLLDLGYSRSDCQRIIADAGLPVPPKSSCFFCPFHRPAAWAEMRRDEPDLFDRSVLLEDTLNRRREKLEKDPVYLTRFGRPLAEAITEAQPTLFGDDGPESCDEGYCWT